MSATRGAVFPSQFKVQMLNAFVDTLREEGHWASVARGLTPEARDYGDNPRGPSSWFAGAIVLEMQVVAYELLEMRRPRAVACCSVERSILEHCVVDHRGHLSALWHEPRGAARAAGHVQQADRARRRAAVRRARRHARGPRDALPGRARCPTRSSCSRPARWSRCSSSAGSTVRSTRRGRC